jgi:hypothetical protein
MFIWMYIDRFYKEFKKYQLLTILIIHNINLLIPIDHTPDYVR